MELTKNFTPRGFGKIEFTDRYGVACSLQESSLATERAIWLGCNDADPRVCVPGKGWVPVPLPEDAVANTRMHLTQEQVKELLPYLQHFAETGEVLSDINDAKTPEPSDSWELYIVLMEDDGRNGRRQFEIDVRATNVHHAKDVAQLEHPNWKPLASMLKKVEHHA
jgi:hypothetical protein